MIKLLLAFAFANMAGAAFCWSDERYIDAGTLLAMGLFVGYVGSRSS